MPQADVSVIIPAYCAAPTICRALESVREQTVTPREVIVVDDGSPDELAELVRQFPEPVRLVRIANAGAANARNVGIDASGGQFIAFLDADDYWSRNKLEVQLECFARHPELGSIAGRFFLQDVQGSRQLARTTTARYDHVLRLTGAQAFLLGTMMWTGTVMVRRETLGHERFVAGLEPAEDRDLWVRIAARAPLMLLSQPLATAVLEKGGISRGAIGHDCAQMLAVIDRHRQMLGPLAYRRWRSYVHYRWAAMEASPARASANMLRSFVQWPIPYTDMPAMETCGRLRRALSLLKRLGWTRSPHTTSQGAL